MLRKIQPLLFFSRANVTPCRAKYLNKIDNHSGLWAFVSDVTLEPCLSTLYFSMLSAVLTSTVAWPLIVLSTWLHAKTIYFSLTLLTFLFWVRDGQKKATYWIKEVEGAGWLLFSEYLHLVTCTKQNGCWDRCPGPSLSSLCTRPSFWMPHTLTRCEHKLRTPCIMT